MLVALEHHGPLMIVRLNDPERRNAMSEAMFRDLESALDQAEEDHAVRVILLTGAGGTFCAGFDLGAAVEKPELIRTFIQRLSRLNRRLRQSNAIIVAAAEGAALAGGCALLTACDFVFASPETKLGCPVHRIGVSPAVTIATLSQMVGDGPARTLLMGGRIIAGDRAHEIGLITHLSATTEAIERDARAWCEALIEKPPRALAITKGWLNELDGSLHAERFGGPAEGSAELAGGEEAVSMLERFWSRRREGRAGS